MATPPADMQQRLYADLQRFIDLEMAAAVITGTTVSNGSVLGRSFSFADVQVAREMLAATPVPVNPPLPHFQTNTEIAPPDSSDIPWGCHDLMSMTAAEIDAHFDACEREVANKLERRVHGNEILSGSSV